MPVMSAFFTVRVRLALPDARVVVLGRDLEAALPKEAVEAEVAVVHRIRGGDGERRVLDDDSAGAECRDQVLECSSRLGKMLDHVDCGDRIEHSGRQRSPWVEDFYAVA